LLQEPAAANRLRAPSVISPLCCCFSFFFPERFQPDGTRLATGCYDSRARIWSVDGGLQAVLTGHTQPILSLQFSPNGQHVVTGSVDKTAMVWDASSGSSVATYSFHSAAVLDIDWASDNLFAACSSDKTITLCSLSSSDSGSSSSGGGRNAPYKTFAGHGDEVNAIQWSPNKTILASASDDMTCKLWSLSSASSSSGAGGAGSAAGDGCVATLSGHKKSVYSVKWAPTGEGSKNPGRDAAVAT
jgi:transducin (beta)-like 1